MAYLLTFVVGVALAFSAGFAAEPVAPYNRVLDSERIRCRFDRFSADDEELCRNAIENGRVMLAFGDKIPLFECPDEDIERTYYFRWWTYRKHLRKTPSGWVVTEFLPDVSWAGKYNTISCPFGHHLREGRWLRDQSFIDDYTRIMVREGNVNGPKAYLSWPAWATVERAKVTGDLSFAKRMLGDFVANYETWEKGWQVRGLSVRDTGSTRSYKGRQVQSGFRAERGLFDFAGDREGSEFALSLDGARPMVNAAMWAEARAIAEIAEGAGDKTLAARFAAKAASLEKNIRAKLWNRNIGFFVTLGIDGEQDSVKELHGYAPFYFGMPLDSGFDGVWKWLVRETGFSAPKGLTFPTRDTPGFSVSDGVEAHECLWNGPSWPYATSIALTALGRTLQVRGGMCGGVGGEDFARLLHQYAAQQVRVREDGRKVPWIDENLDPFTGEWLARKIMIEQDRLGRRKMNYRERGKDYNHSTFCDLVISGLCGFVPQRDGTIVVKPLAPAAWDWWCLDGIRYHGHDIAVFFDREGHRYGKGKGLVILKDGERQE